MSFTVVFIWLFTVVGMYNFIHLGLYIVGANVYDILHVRQKAKAVRNPATTPYEPLVTVLIPAHNEETGILSTIDTVARSTYKYCGGCHR